MSEFLLFTATIESYPWLAAPLLLGLLIAMAGLFRFVQPMVYGNTSEHAKHVRVNMAPVYVHFALALLLGLAIPSFLSDWYHQAASLIVGGGT